jgi:hypothetical protein
MRHLGDLTAKDQNIVDTILMRCEREWISVQALARELGLPNGRHIRAYVNLLKAEGYVFKNKYEHPSKTNLTESFIRIVDFKERHKQ